MTDNITVIGVVGGDPRVHVTTQGLPITSFRLASTRRFFDRAKGTWENGETNWYTVSAFRQLAKNAAVSVRRGDRVVVHGRLRLRAWENGEKSGTAIEIEADSVGHDLSWGTTSLTRNHAGTSTDASSEGANALPSTEDVGVTGWATALGADDAGAGTLPSFGEHSDEDESGAAASAGGYDPDDSEESAGIDHEPAHVPF